MAIYKVVNIHPQGKPITALNQMIRSDIMGAKLTTDQIREIILQKGAVREVLPDGSTVALTLANYTDTNLYEKKLELERQEAAKIKQAQIERSKSARAIVDKNKARREALSKLKKDTISQPTQRIDTSAIVTNAAAAANIKDDNVPRVSKVPTIQTGIMTDLDNVNTNPYASVQRDFTNKGKTASSVISDSADAVARARARIEANKQKK